MKQYGNIVLNTDYNEVIKKQVSAFDPNEEIVKEDDAKAEEEAVKIEE